MNWISRLAFDLDTAKGTNEPESDSRPRLYFDSVFDLRFRNVLSNPASLDSSNVLGAALQFGRCFLITERLAVSFPLYVWNRQNPAYYSIGGHDSIRGYVCDSISAFRYALLNTDVALRLFPDSSVGLRFGKRRARARELRLLLMMDALIMQDRLSWQSAVKPLASAGGGLSFLVTGERQRQLRVSTQMVQAFEHGRSPILYFQASFFSFERRL